MTDWERARDKAADTSQQDAGLTLGTDVGFAYFSGFQAGADFGRAWEAKRAEALTKLATAAVNLWRASQVSYSPTLLAQLELTMHHLYEALAAYKGET